MPKKVEIEILDSAVGEEYTILAVDKIYVQIEDRGKTVIRRADVNLVPPLGKEWRIAFPHYAGVGPAPEGTTSIQYIYDRIFNAMTEIENAIAAREQDSEKTF